MTNENRANAAALDNALRLLRRRRWIIRMQRIVIALLCAALIAVCSATGHAALDDTVFSFSNHISRYNIYF